MAANHLRNGDCDVVLTGGVEASVAPVSLGGFVACRALTQNFNDEPEKASRPWDSERSGFVLGEGSGVLVFETLEHAEKRGANIICEYLGGALTCDAYHITNPRPDGAAVSSCIINALKDANVDRDAVNYINAHATSTQVGDIAEVNAIKEVFSNLGQIKMNATKSLIGHALGGAGGLEAIALIKAIETGQIHPTLNQNNIIPEIDGLDTCPNKKVHHDVNVGISNSFGFGGHNAVSVFGKFKG